MDLIKIKKLLNEQPLYLKWLFPRHLGNQILSFSPARNPEPIVHEVQIAFEALKDDNFGSWYQWLFPDIFNGLEQYFDTTSSDLGTTTNQGSGHDDSDLSSVDNFEVDEQAEETDASGFSTPTSEWLSFNEDCDNYRSGDGKGFPTQNLVNEVLISIPGHYPSNLIATLAKLEAERVISFESNAVPNKTQPRLTFFSIKLIEKLLNNFQSLDNLATFYSCLNKIKEIKLKYLFTKVPEDSRVNDLYLFHRVLEGFKLLELQSEFVSLVLKKPSGQYSFDSVLELVSIVRMLKLNWSLRTDELKHFLNTFAKLPEISLDAFEEYLVKNPVENEKFQREMNVIKRNAWFEEIKVTPFYEDSCDEPSWGRGYLDIKTTLDTLWQTKDTMDYWTEFKKTIDYLIKLLQPNQEITVRDKEYYIKFVCAVFLNCQTNQSEQVLTAVKTLYQLNIYTPPRRERATMAYIEKYLPPLVPHLFASETIELWDKIEESNFSQMQFLSLVESSRWLLEEGRENEIGERVSNALQTASVRQGCNP